MSDISELNILLESLLHEKIMTKKQAARKRKLRAKRRAEKKAQQKEQNKQQEIEVTQPGTALVVFEQPTAQDDYDEVSDVFKKAMELFGPALEKHKEDIDKAMALWKSAGKDKACPQEAWNLMYNSITELKKILEDFVNNTNFNDMPEPELIITDKVVTGLNNYIKKAEQEILAAKPNLEQDDFKAPAVTNSTDLVADDKKEVTVTNTEPEYHTKAFKTLPTLPDDKHRQKENIVDYDAFYGGFKDLYSALGLLWQGIKTIGKVIANGVIAVLKLAAHPLSWIDDRAWAFLESPVAKDFIKTLAYTNPITAFIFDGKLGNFGIGNALNKLHDAIKGLETGGKNLKYKSITDKNPQDYDARKFPKDLSGKNLKQLKTEFYSNKALVDCINVAYNHPDVRTEDKATLRKACTTIPRAIATKKIDTVRKNLNIIISTLNNVCDYMSWNSSKDWQNLVTKYIAKGNTEKDLKRIETKNKPKTQPKKDLVAQDAASYITEKLPRQEIVKKLTSDNFGHSAEEVNKYLDKINYQESYNANLKELIKLLEQAEA